MEFKTTLEIVTKDIQDIEKLVGNFKNYSRIPNIELDLALSRLRNVYDLLLMFRDEAFTETHKPEIKQENKESVPGHEVKANHAVDPVLPVSEKPGEISSSVVETATPDASDELVIIPEIDVKLKDPDDKGALHKPEIKKKPEDEKVFIHEKLGKQSPKKDISSKLQNQSIKSISGNLGINDKFLLIRELFSGNAENFRQTMTELDESRNFNDAYSMLMSKYQWDMDSESVQMLLNLVRRKFISSGNE